MFFQAESPSPHNFIVRRKRVKAGSYIFNLERVIEFAPPPIRPRLPVPYSIVIIAEAKNSLNLTKSKTSE